MKKKLILRGALGFPLGISVSHLITILLSLIWADGYYSPCVPELIQAMGNEIKAILLQAFLSGLLGTGFGAASVIWDIEHWSLVKQTGIYFGIVSLIMLPTAYCLYWTAHSAAGILSYFGIFILIFFLIWIIEWIAGKRLVRKMNAGLDQAKYSEKTKN